jgi:hypothetical protein
MLACLKMNSSVRSSMLSQEYFINSVSINEIRRQATYRSTNHPSSCQIKALLLRATCVSTHWTVGTRDVLPWTCLISSENARLHKTACTTGVPTHVFYTKHLSEFIFIVMLNFALEQAMKTRSGRRRIILLFL